MEEYQDESTANRRKNKGWKNNKEGQEDRRVTLQTKRLETCKKSK
jgi:hypothetical protein